MRLLYSMIFPGNVRELESYCSNGLKYTKDEIEKNLLSGIWIISKPKLPKRTSKEDSYHFRKRQLECEEKLGKYYLLKDLENYSALIEEYEENIHENKDEDISYNRIQFDFEKCIREYEFETLFNNTNASKEEIAKAMYMRVETFTGEKFKEYFGFEFPKKRYPNSYRLSDFCEAKVYNKYNG